MIARFKGLRIAMNTIVDSLQQIINVVALSFIVILIFAVFGVQMFKGTFYRCVIDGNDEIALYDDRIMTKQDCLDLGYEWSNPTAHFDDMVNATLNLMVFMTNEGWVKVMIQSTDSIGINMQPKRDSNLQFTLYFVVYMIVSHVFILNLFVGVIIQRFNSMHERLQGYTRNKVCKRKWIDIQRLMMKQKIEEKWFMPEAGIQHYFAVICTMKQFDIFIYIIIVANVIVLAMPYNGMTELYANVLDYLSMAFSIIYNIEAFIKLMGLRARYFHDKWNILDLLIVVSTDAGAIISQYTDTEVTVMMPVIRALRVTRILKLLKGNSGLKVLVEAITNLFLNLVNILGLHLLLIFIYAVLGMNLFHGVIYQENYDKYTNFRTFDNSLLLLVRCITGEGWDLIMADLAFTGKYDGVQCVYN